LKKDIGIKMDSQRRGKKEKTRKVEKKVQVKKSKVSKTRLFKYFTWNPGDQKIWKKITQVLEKVAQTVAKLKMPKYLHQNIDIKLPLNSLNTYNRPNFHPKIHLRLKK
jgi:hypothetical protein